MTGAQTLESSLILPRHQSAPVNCVYLQISTAQYEKQRFSGNRLFSSQGIYYKSFILSSYIITFKMMYIKIYV